jgi:hypothetical protein
MGTRSPSWASSQSAVLCYGPLLHDVKVAAATIECAFRKWKECVLTAVSGNVAQVAQGYPTLLAS